MKQTFVAIMMIMLVLSGSAFCKESITVELVDGALLIMADDAAAADLEQKVEALKKDAGTAEKLMEAISSEHWDGVTVELFEKPSMASMSGVKVVTFTMREAQLRGVLPPLEGLERESAVKVLKVFGIETVDMDVFDEGNSGALAKKVYMARGKLVAFRGTGAFDTVKILTGEQAE